MSIAKVLNIVFLIIILILLYDKYYTKNSVDKLEIVNEEEENKRKDSLKNPALSDINNDYFFNKKTNISFEKDLYVLDTIEEGTVLKKDFYFYNKGENKLFVHDVKASCGCTVPYYEKRAIEKNEKAKISITYNSSSKVGFNMNKITLYGNFEKNESSVYFTVIVMPKKK